MRSGLFLPGFTGWAMVGTCIDWSILHSSKLLHGLTAALCRKPWRHNIVSLPLLSSSSVLDMLLLLLVLALLLPALLLVAVRRTVLEASVRGL